MIFVTNYKVKPFLSKAQTSDLMAAFAEVGTAPGTTATTCTPTEAAAS